jgi:hypothetical protein
MRTSIDYAVDAVADVLAIGPHPKLSEAVEAAWKHYDPTASLMRLTDDELLHEVQARGLVDPVLERLRSAIEDEGRFPTVHRAIMERHRQQWPYLWKVLDAALGGEE